MGRKKSEIPKGSFWVKAAPNAKGDRPIYLKYYVEGRYAKRSTDLWVLPDDWDEKKQEVKSKNKSAARLNGKLTSLKKKVDDQLLSFTDGVITWRIVQEMLDGRFVPEGEKAKVIQFIDYCNSLNETLYKREDYGYSVYYNGKLYIKQFEKFLTEYKHLSSLSLQQVSKELFDEYVGYKINVKQYKTNEGINKSLTPLIKAVRYARDNGLIEMSKAQPILDGAYLEVKSRTYNPEKEEAREVRYLSDEQIEDFIAYEPRSNRKDATKDIKDVFLFSLYACGLRISDIVTLEWSNIDFEERKISKIQVKTKQRSKVSPRLPEQAVEILQKWQARHLNERFVFNYLPQDFVFSKETSHALKMRINAVDRTINTSLNHIGKQLGLPFSLTIHVARHTFCVKALNAGMSLHLVSQLMGHSSILATEKTYARYLDSTVDREMDKLVGIFTKK